MHQFLVTLPESEGREGGYLGWSANSVSSIPLSGLKMDLFGDFLGITRHLFFYFEYNDSHQVNANRPSTATKVLILHLVCPVHLKLLILIFGHFIDILFVPRKNDSFSAPIAARKLSYIGAKPEL